MMPQLNRGRRRRAMTHLPAFFVRYQTLERKNGSCDGSAQRALFLLQHELALLLDQRLGLLCNHAEQPRQLDLDAHVIVGHVNAAAGGLAQDGNAQIEVIARPVLLQHRELSAESGAGALQSRLQATRRFVAAEVMRDGYDDGLCHGRLLSSDTSRHVGSRLPLWKRRRPPHDEKSRASRCWRPRRQAASVLESAPASPARGMS